jgi:adenylate kinase
MEKINTNIILLGPQGSGKSTQAQLLSSKYNLHWIITGQLLRNIVSQGGQKSKEVNKYISAGELVPDSILFEYIYEPYLKKIKSNQKIIFDGMPRNIDQMKKFHQLISKLNISRPILLVIDVPDDCVYKRISLRKMCPQCGTSYKPDDKQYKKNICSKCFKKLVKRQDDINKQALQKRLSIYHSQTKKIISFYRKNNLLITVDGRKSVKEVFNDIVNKLTCFSNE